MSGALKGKVALVTGASSGIGRASALAFAQAGALVAVAADRNIEGGEETARLIRQAGGEAAFLRADVSREEDVEALIAQVVRTYGRLDCAHNNAGTSEGARYSLDDLTTETWQRILGVNLTGTWLCMRHEILQMRKQGSGGAIVNTASVWGLRGTHGWGFTPYVASKHGVVGITKTAAVEFARENIRVNAICPGPVRTPPIEEALARAPHFEAAIAARIPLGRIATPEDIAGSAVFLCTPAAAYITGVALEIDGGELAADRSRPRP